MVCAMMKASVLSILFVVLLAVAVIAPKRFVRVRHSGVLANRSKSLLSKCRQLLDLYPAVPKLPQKSVHPLMLELTGIDITRCPLCQKGTLVLFANLPVPVPWDSS